MHKKKRIAIFAVAIAILSTTSVSRANSTSHIIINEIRTAGSGTDEFVELFNPTQKSIDLSGYKLAKKTKTGSESTILSSSKFLGTIESHGYFLIAHPSYKDAISADLAYSSSSYYVGNENTILLYDNAAALVDKVGFGLSSDSEGNFAPNPNSDESLERKNFVDTDNNAVDFAISTSPSPQNSSFTENENEESSEEPGSPADEDDNEDISLNEPGLCASESGDIKLNEIFPYPENENEFVEVENTGDECVDISGWKVMDGAGHKKEFPADTMIGPGKYVYLEGNLYLNNDSDTVYLLDKNGNEKNDALENKTYKKTEKNFSYSLLNGNWSWTSTPTPGKENDVISPEKETSKTTSETTGDSTMNENYILSGKIFLNEIFPSPKKDSKDEEYIEIGNGGSEAVDLFGWKIKDASKGKGYEFKEHISLNPDEYISVLKSESKISLNNSSESVTLYNSQGEIASSISYDKSQSGASYNFDGKNWKWSKYLTPGKKNKFDSEPSVKITKPKYAYKGILAEFGAKAKDKETKKLKYAWDFGDGKKSNLAETSHKYLDTGKYTVTLSVTDESQTVAKSFTVTVKNLSRPDIEIVKIVPNPAGADSESETIDLKNNSKKKVDLSGWKIATGSGKKMYNHPIISELSLDPGQTKTVTRENSKFSLNNKAGKITLVMPDGKTVDKVEYTKDPPDSLRDSKRAGKIAEDEAYAKIDGEWQWLVPNEEGDISHDPGETEFIDDPTGEIESQENSGDESMDGEVLGVSDEAQSDSLSSRSSFNSENAYIFLSRFGFDQSSPEPNYCPMNNSSLSFAYLLASSM